MIIYTPEGTVVAANPAASRIYGYAPEQLIGVHAPDVIHPDARPMFAEFLRVAAPGGSSAARRSTAAQTARRSPSRCWARRSTTTGGRT